MIDAITEQPTGPDTKARDRRPTPTPPAEGTRENNEAKLRAVHERLTAAIGDLTSAENWQLMLRTAAKLPTYSPRNVLLITSQCPHASAVAGFHTWRQLGRSVRKGEKGLAILAPVLGRHTSQDSSREGAASGGGDATARPPAGSGPGSELSGASVSGDRPSGRVAGFRVVHLFDISQTDGPDLPEPPRPVLLDGQAPAGLLDGLTRQVNEEGFGLLRHDFDVPHPGMGVPNGVTDYFARTVIVRPDLSDAQAAKTLAHELGHVLLHEPTRRPADLTRQRAEVEAESVAHIVADAHGLDTSTYTLPYVAGWSDGNLELLASSAERVIATSHQILTRTPPPPTFALSGTTRTNDRSRTEGRSESRVDDRSGSRAEGLPAAEPTSVAVGFAAQRDTTTPGRAAQRSRADALLRSSNDAGREASRDTTQQGRLW